MASTPNLHNPRGTRRLSHASDYDALPQPLRAILQALASPREMAYSALCALLAKQGFDQASIDGGLHSLVQEGYLESFYDEELYYLLRANASGKFSPKTEEGRWDSFRYGLDSLDADEEA